MRHVRIISEAGVNHNGSLELAKKMVDVAKDAGVDYIKFQTFVPEKLVSKHAEKAKYQQDTTGADESQLHMLKKLALSRSEFIELKAYCDDAGIGFVSTPFDLDSIEFLNSFDMDFWKIPSGEITNYPYLKAIAETGKDVVLSTGMATLGEIREAIEILKKYGAGQIELLHCNTQYPTPMEDVNLLAIRTMSNEFNCQVGYSDHTKGIEVPIAAVAMGANIIEKHFTLDNNMKGPDHSASLEPHELKKMVESIRNIELAFGSGTKEPSKSEQPNIEAVRKSIVAVRKIKKGEVFSECNITTKRPGGGLSPMKWNDVIGCVADKDFEEDELIEL